VVHFGVSVEKDPANALAHAMLYEADAMLAFMQDAAMANVH
jgi:hypothetical protein